MSATYLVETDSATPVAVQDLGILVSKQKPVFITQAQLKSSLLLAELRSIGTLRVSKGSPAREVRAALPTPPKPVKLEYQAPSPKGVHKPPAPPQRPARVAPPRRAAAKPDVPEAPVEPSVRRTRIVPRKDAAPPEDQNG